MPDARRRLDRSDRWTVRIVAGKSPGLWSHGIVRRSHGLPSPDRVALGVAAPAVPREEFLIVRDGRVVELARVHEFLQVHMIERIRAKRIDARLRGGPLPRQLDFLCGSESFDAGHEQAV